MAVPTVGMLGHVVTVFARGFNSRRSPHFKLNTLLEAPAVRGLSHAMRYKQELNKLKELSELAGEWPESERLNEDVPGWRDGQRPPPGKEVEGR